MERSSTLTASNRSNTMSSISSTGGRWSSGQKQWGSMISVVTPKMKQQLLDRDLSADHPVDSLSRIQCYQSTQDIEIRNEKWILLKRIHRGKIIGTHSKQQIEHHIVHQFNWREVVVWTKAMGFNDFCGYSKNEATTFGSGFVCRSPRRLPCSNIVLSKYTRYRDM